MIKIFKVTTFIFSNYSVKYVNCTEEKAYFRFLALLRQSSLILFGGKKVNNNP